MNAWRVAAIVLIVAGVLALVYGGFSYTSETHEARVGPIELSVSEQRRVNVPLWAGVGAILLGGVLAVAGGRRNA
jgi:drug/metabolite transporter (DMT)-like permease